MSTPAESVDRMAAALAATNMESWHDEDHARPGDDSRVASAKRRVVQLEQGRNGLLERIERLGPSLGRPEHFDG